MFKIIGLEDATNHRRHVDQIKIGHKMLENKPIDNNNINEENSKHENLSNRPIGDQSSNNNDISIFYPNPKQTSTPRKEKCNEEIVIPLRRSTRIKIGTVQQLKEGEVR